MAHTSRRIMVHNTTRCLGRHIHCDLLVLCSETSPPINPPMGVHINEALNLLGECFTPCTQDVILGPPLLSRIDNLSTIVLRQHANMLQWSGGVSCGSDCCMLASEWSVVVCVLQRYGCPQPLPVFVCGCCACPLPRRWCVG